MGIMVFVAGITSACLFLIGILAIMNEIEAR
jgi:hypothetical protein